MDELFYANNDTSFEERKKGIDACLKRAKELTEKGEPRSLAFVGHIVELWEGLLETSKSGYLTPDIGSDQTSLHNPYAGGYYPVGLNFKEGKVMMADEPEKFKEGVHAALVRHTKAVNALTESHNLYFFDYGNAFLLMAGRAGADIIADNDKNRFRYASYVEDIMGPLCFDYGFGPFRWVCASGDESDLDKTDEIACKVLEDIAKTAPKEIEQQLKDNITWSQGAKKNKLVVGSQARILYADCQGRTAIARAFNKAIKSGELKGPVILGRDHHDVSGTDSPFRETSNIYDGSNKCADMAIQNVIGDSFRGATWVSIHNGGGVGWGEVCNGGFGMLLDGSEAADGKLASMLHWDVCNGIARRAWGRNPHAQFAIGEEEKREKRMQVTKANLVEDETMAKIKSEFPMAGI